MAGQQDPGDLRGRGLRRRAIRRSSPSRTATSRRWALSPTPATSRSTTSRRMRGFTGSAGACSVRSKPGPRDGATPGAPSRAPRLPGASIWPMAMPRMPSLREIREQVRAIRCPGCWRRTRIGGLHDPAHRAAGSRADRRLEPGGRSRPQLAVPVRRLSCRSSGSTRRLWKNLSTSRDRVSAVAVRSLEAVSTDDAALLVSPMA